MTSYSTCTAHPSTEAIGRCKQCGKPYCGACRVQGPTGYFCSEGCKTNHEAFIQRAKKLDDMKSGFQFGTFIRNAVMVIVILAIGSVIAHYFGYDIPVVGGFLDGVVPRAN